MKKSILFLTSVIFLNAWQLNGTTKPINITPVDSTDNLIWAYQNGEWKTNFKTDKYPLLTKIDGGEGFWSYSSFYLENDSYNDTYKWKEGWNLVTLIFENWNLEEKFKDNSPAIWTYKNGKWYLYSKVYSYQNTFDTLNKGEGAWVYLPSINIKMNNIPLFCKDGKCSKLYTTDTNYHIYLKTSTYNTDLKFAFDLYRYSNSKHYKLAFGPFEIDGNQIKTSVIPVCVEKEGVGGSCKKVDNTTDTFVTYQNGYIKIDSQKVASLFDKSIPNTKEKFKMKIYIKGFDVNGFKDDADFGTLGIEGFGTWVTVTDNKSIEFEMEIK